MIFLIEYDRTEGELVNLIQYSDAERRAAENARLELELDLNRKGIFHEVVLLEAASEDALRPTHRRCFADLAEIVGSSSGGGVQATTRTHPTVRI